MKALMQAIKNRRMGKMADMEEFEERKDANFNPDEGSRDDLDIVRDDIDDLGEEKEREDDSVGYPNEDMDELDGMAPETAHPLSPDKESSDIEESLTDKLYNPDDVGKPGIKGKVAAKMKAFLKR